MNSGRMIGSSSSSANNNPNSNTPNQQHAYEYDYITQQQQYQHVQGYGIPSMYTHANASSMNGNMGYSMYDNQPYPKVCLLST